MNNFYLAFLGIKTYIRKLETCKPDVLTRFQTQALKKQGRLNIAFQKIGEIQPS